MDSRWRRRDAPRTCCLGSMLWRIRWSWTLPHGHSLDWMEISSKGKIYTRRMRTEGWLAFCLACSREQCFQQNIEVFLIGSHHTSRLSSYQRSFQDKSLRNRAWSTDWTFCPIRIKAYRRKNRTRNIFTSKAKLCNQAADIGYYASCFIYIWDESRMNMKISYHYNTLFCFLRNFEPFENRNSNTLQIRWG